MFGIRSFLKSLVVRVKDKVEDRLGIDDEKDKNSTTEINKPEENKPVEQPVDQNREAVKSLCFNDEELQYALGLYDSGKSVDEVKNSLAIYRTAPKLKEWCTNNGYNDYYKQAYAKLEENPNMTLEALQDYVKTLATPVVEEPEYDAEGYNKEGYDVNGYDREGFNKDGIDKDGYNREGYDVNGYDREGYAKDGFNKDGIDREGYDRNGYKDGYNREGYDVNGYDKNGFNKDGLDKDGYDRNGYKDGYNREGYDSDGYARDGFNKEGVDRDGYDREGYKDGYNREGYDKNGYDREGYAKDGFNKDGIDRDGYDRNGYKDGYNREGFGKDGYNAAGYDKDGYARDGYNVEGYDREGYARDGYNKNGVNKKGETRTITVDAAGNTTVKYLDSEGRPTSSTITNLSGKVLNSVVWTYDSKNPTTYNEVTTDEAGNRLSYFYENGKKVKSTFYDVKTRSSKTTFYDANGNALPPAKDRLKSGSWKSIKVAGFGVDISHSELYSGIVNIDDKFKIASGSGFVKKLINSAMPTARQAIKSIYGQHTADFLGYCQKDYNGTPANAKKYNSYKDTPYADYIGKRINSALFEDYGYKAEDLKGYHFNSSAQVSKDMAANSDLTNWVKKNINTIISPGISVDNPGAMKFTSTVNEDLYLSIASATVIDSNITGRTLTLTMFDIYDFDVNAKDGLNGTAAAAMLDGEIVPYYFTSDVKIDLTTIFTEQELKNLGL